MRIQHITDAAIEALYHAVSLRPVRGYQTVLHRVMLTELIHPMFASRSTFSPCRKTVSETLAIVCQQRFDFERGLLANVM